MRYPVTAFEFEYDGNIVKKNKDNAFLFRYAWLYLII